MEIHVEHYPDKSIIVIEKNKLIGIENENFQSLVQDSIDKGSKTISVDLSNVEYISSWGIGILVQTYTTCTNRNIKFKIKVVSENVMNVLHQVKLDRLFDISDKL
jgi:anti-anti-sigma factor